MDNRNCPFETDNNYDNINEALMTGICFGMPGEVEFLEDATAGHTCEGGTYDQRDSNEEPLYLTEDQCLNEGGGTSYVAYTCSDSQTWLGSGGAASIGITDEVKEYLRTSWWQPKCCHRVID